MKGHIRKRGKESWSIIIDLGRDETGKRRQKWATVRGLRADAERELRRLLTSLDQGTFVEPNKLVVGEYLEQWLKNYAKSSVSGKTFERYADIVRSHLIPAFGSIPLLKLQPLHIQGYYTKALESGRRNGLGGLSAQTVLHHHRVLREALNRAIKWRLLIRNPADAVEPPKPEHKDMRALTETETAKLLERARSSKAYMPVLIAVTTGMRRGELLALRWKDVDLNNAGLSVRQSLEQTKEGLRFKQPKTTKGRRTIALPSLLVDALRVHKAEQAKVRLMMGPGYQDHGLVYANPDGTPYPPDSLTATFRSMVRKTALVGVRFHDLRHTHATQLLLQGVHPKIVSERLGHATVSITLDLYSHVLPGMQEDAALKVDAALRAAIKDSA